MNTKRCNGCSKLLKKNMDYYTINEIDFHKGSAEQDTIRLYFNDDKKEAIYDSKNSWTTYTDIDFCPECFKKEQIERFL